MARARRGADPVTAPGFTATAALSQGGAATTLGGAALLFIAAISAHPALVSAGALMWGVVAFALARARARANALSSLKLRLAPVAVKPRGAPLECVISVSHDGPFPLNRLTLRLVGDGASRIDVTCVVDVPAASSGEVSLSITLPVAGHSMLHGVELLWRDALGLAEATSWRPFAMAIRADTGPVADARAHALLELAGLVTDHDGRRSAHRRGGGVELRELRDYVPGDPLRAVAWKATARRQRPLVRTTEDDTRHHLQLLVDVGPALRVGPEGERPLDRLLDLAAALLQAASADRVGLTLFDTRIVSHLDAEVGHAALRRCKQRLLDATHLVDDDLTEVPDTEVLARVAAHLDRDAPGQFDFTRSARARASFTLSSVDPLREAIDESAVHTAVARALLADRARRAASSRSACARHVGLRTPRALACASPARCSDCHSSTAAHRTQRVETQASPRPSSGVDAPVDHERWSSSPTSARSIRKARQVERCERCRTTSNRSYCSAPPRHPKKLWSHGAERAPLFSVFHRRGRARLARARAYGAADCVQSRAAATPQTDCRRRPRRRDERRRARGLRA